jgi:hypothetical protein
MMSLQKGSTGFLWLGFFLRFLWLDLWEGRVCSQAYPELFCYAKTQHISLSVAASTPLLQNLSHLPLSNEA